MVAVRVEDLSPAVLVSLSVDLPGVVAAVEIGDPALFDSHNIINSDM
jgi:hypothetical protein